MNPNYSDSNASSQPFPHPQKASDLISPEKLMQYSRLWQWFFWFNLNKLDNIELFSGTNPIEYDNVLYMLQGAEKKDVKERLELILYAASTKSGLTARDLLEISAQFQPSNGGDNMEGKCALEQLADMYEEQGIAQGIARGEVRGRAKSILNLLRRRFGNTPKSVENAINRMQDIPVLDSYFELAFDCKTIEEFESSLPNS